MLDGLTEIGDIEKIKLFEPSLTQKVYIKTLPNDENNKTQNKNNITLTLSYLHNLWIDKGERNTSGKVGEHREARITNKSPKMREYSVRHCLFYFSIY